MHKWLLSNNNDLPTVIGGDFNMSPPAANGRSRHLKTDTLWSEMRETLLSEYLEAPLDYGNLTTYRGESGTLNKDEGVLDHIFSFNGPIPILGELDFKGTVFCGMKNNKALNYPYSDHLGMASTLVLES